MTDLNGLISAFALFSKIPMPKRDFSAGNLRNTFIGFPLVGVAVCAVMYAWMALSARFRLPKELFAAVCVYLPILITGGIHFDGLIDVADAKNSHGDIDKMWSILKDPHVGAFGVINAVTHIVLSYALWCGVYTGTVRTALPLAGYVFSRVAVSVFAVTTEPAQKGGFLYALTEDAPKKLVLLSSIAYIIFASVLLIKADLAYFIIAITLYGLYCLYFKASLVRRFQGLSGDLCGNLIQMSELIFLAAAAIRGVLI